MNPINIPLFDKLRLRSLILSEKMKLIFQVTYLTFTDIKCQRNSQ